MPVSFALNSHSLWFMDYEDNRIRIILFDWNNEEWQTEGVRERLLSLPEGIKVKREAYCGETSRRHMAQHLMQQLW